MSLSAQDAKQPEPQPPRGGRRKLAKQAEVPDTSGYIGRAQKSMRVDLTLEGKI